MGSRFAIEEKNKMCAICARFGVTEAAVRFHVRQGTINLTTVEPEVMAWPTRKKQNRKIKIGSAPAEINAVTIPARSGRPRKTEPKDLDIGCFAGEKAVYVHGAWVRLTELVRVAMPFIVSEKEKEKEFMRELSELGNEGGETWVTVQQQAD